MNPARGDTFSKFSWHSIAIWLLLVWVCAPRNGSVPMKAGELHSIQTTNAKQSPLNIMQPQETENFKEVSLASRERREENGN